MGSDELKNTPPPFLQKVKYQQKHWALTYSCPQHLDANPITSKETLRDALLELFPPPLLSGYVIGKEQHKSSKTHYHVYLLFKDKFTTRNAKAFDILGVHPNILEARQPKGWIAYCIKDGDYLVHNIVLPKEKEAEKQNIATAWAVAIELAKENKLKEAEEHLKRYQPMRWLTQGTQIKAQLKAEAAIAKMALHPLLIRETGWIADIDTMDIKTLRPDEDVLRVTVIVGSAGIGKTEAAKYLLKKAGCNNILVVNRLDDLKRIDDYDGFIWDEIDMQTSGASREFQIGMCDLAEDRSFSARYHNVTIARGTPRIFTCNYLDRALKTDDEAIMRRVNVVDFGSKKLYQK